MFGPQHNSTFTNVSMIDHSKWDIQIKEKCYIKICLYLAVLNCTMIVFQKNKKNGFHKCTCKQIKSSIEGNKNKVIQQNEFVANNYDNLF